MSELPSNNSQICPTTDNDNSQQHKDSQDDKQTIIAQESSKECIKTGRDPTDDLLAEFDPLYVSPTPNLPSSTHLHSESLSGSFDLPSTHLQQPAECERLSSLSLLSPTSKEVQECITLSSPSSPLSSTTTTESSTITLQNPKDSEPSPTLPVEQAVEVTDENAILPSALTSSTLTTITNSESDSSGSLAQEYQLKWIQWKGGERYPIVTQNSNGPCPLLAIINVLLLRKAITIPPMYEIITANQLMDFLCDCILSAVPQNIVDEERANYEQNFQDAMSVLPKLATGLDVNVKFNGWVFVVVFFNFLFY